jgi:hypothetical protein
MERQTGPSISDQDNHVGTLHVIPPSVTLMAITLELGAEAAARHVRSAQCDFLKGYSHVPSRSSNERLDGRRPVTHLRQMRGHDLF